jgi:hypothetical protein
MLEEPEATTVVDSTAKLLLLLLQLHLLLKLLNRFYSEEIMKKIFLAGTWVF